MSNSDLDPRAIQNLLASVGGDTAFLKEMIETFLADSPRQIAAMQSAVTTANEEELRRAAHSLKSNAANFGAMDLARLCKELEEAARTGALEGAAERIALIKAENARVAVALEGYGPWTETRSGEK